MGNSVFGEVYEHDSAVKLLKGLLPEDFDLHVVDARVPENVRTVNKASVLGKCESLDLMVFELSHASSSDARINISSDAFRLMENHDCIRAIVIFKSDSSEQWRLSLMTVDYKIDEGKVKKTISNPRRYSFLLGPGAKVHTPTKQLSKKIKNFDDLLSRFSLEVVNKDFYDSIAVLFTELVGGTRTINKKKQEFPGILVLPRMLSSNAYQEFAVRLIGRIVFCWFLKEKKSEDDTPLMPYELLSLEASKNNENYYESILEKLFFETLNVEIEARDRRYLEDSYKLVPYLNGGLFEPHDGDFYKDTKTIPDSWLTKLLEIFETYNFTIDENTISDVDLSIDPEMLGRIFENLLAEINPETGESARKSTGSFYTPREIVNYMVDESLVEILVEKTGIDRDKINALVTYDKLDDQIFPLSQDQKELVVNAVAELKILDPACGSGAFPIGILQKISMILQRADPDASLWFDKQTKSIPDPLLRATVKEKFKNENLDWVRKLGIIKDVIYGVDIQPIAVEIAKLRCFLTLVVEEKIDDSQPNRGIQPLPNLDFKFVAANSLIQLDEGELNLLQDNNLQVKLAEIRSKYFNARTVTSKTKLKEEYRVQINAGSLNDDARTIQIRTFDPFTHKKSAKFFDPQYMFGVSEGFDIVIGNPPYVRQEKFKEIKPALSQRFPLVYDGRADLLVYFYALGSDFLAKHGVLSLITSNKFFVRGYGQKLRTFLTNEFTLISVINFGELPVFKASVDSCILLAKKGPNSSRKVRYFQAKTKDHLFDIENVMSTKSSELGVECFGSDEWSFGSTNEMNLLKKIQSVDSSLGNYVDGKICAGIKTGYDDAFVIFETEKQNLIGASGELEEIIKPWLRGKDITKWKTAPATRYILYTNKNLNLVKNNPTLLEYLSNYKSKLSVRATSQDWYALQQPQIAFTNLFHGPKIIYPDCAKEMRACFDSTGSYGTMAMYFMPYKPFLLGFLNSRLFDWYARMTFASFGDPWNGGRLIFKTMYMKKVPLPKQNSTNQQIFTEVETLVETILREHAKENEYIDKINKLVYQLFEISTEEIEMIENKS